MKSKTKEYLENKKYKKCLYCNYKTKDEEELDNHQITLHGCYSKINPRRKRSSTKSKKRDSPEGNIVNTSDGEVYKWDGYKYIDVYPKFNSIMNKEEPDVVRMGNGKTKYKCKNCGMYNIFLLDPYTCWSMSLKKRIRIPDGSVPIRLCCKCGMNIFKDNRSRTYKWLRSGESRKIPNGIDKDVIMSGILKEELKAEDIVNEVFKL